MSWVSQGGVVLLAAGLAVLLGPWGIRVARGEFGLMPREPVIVRRAFKRVAIVGAIGLTLLCGALVLQSSAGR
jgi:hypothetical protein